MLSAKPQIPRVPLSFFDVTILQSDSPSSLSVHCWVAVSWDMPAVGNWTPKVLAQLVKEDESRVLISTSIPVYKGTRSWFANGTKESWKDDEFCAEHICNIQDMTKKNTIKLTYHVDDPNIFHCGTYACSAEDPVDGHFEKRNFSFDKSLPFCMSKSNSYTHHSLNLVQTLSRSTSSTSLAEISDILLSPPNMFPFEKLKMC